MAAPLALPAGGRSLPKHRSGVKVATGMFMAAGTMLVAALVAAYLNIRHNTKTGWPPGGLYLSNYEGATCLVTMLLAGVTAEWTVWAVHREERRQAYGAFAATIALGIAFLNMLVFSATTFPFGAGDHPFGALVFSMYAVAGLIAIAAIIFMIVAFARFAGQQVDHERPEIVRAAAFFFQFSVAAWAGIFLTIFGAR